MTSVQPQVFISYSHDSDAHKKWIIFLASELRKNGVDVILDQWDLRLGQDVSAFMDGIRECERVLIICTDNYVKKANAGKGGVGYERTIVTAELVENSATDKFIPIIRGPQKPKMPIFIGARTYADFTKDTKFHEQLDLLLRELHKVPLEKPDLGQSPFSSFVPQNDADLEKLPWKLNTTKVTINLLDRKGEEALLLAEKTAIPQFPGTETYHWVFGGDGPLTDFEVAPGTIIKDYKEADKRHIVQGFNYVLEAKKPINLKINYKVLDSYMQEEEYYFIGVSEPAEKILVQIYFPTDRPCLEANVLRIVGETAFMDGDQPSINRQRNGISTIIWTKEHPKFRDIYKITWKW